MNCYDVIIVGAGPAGLNCAQMLCHSSLKVLLLEKNEEIGPKVCAGGLTGKGIDFLNLPDELVEFKFNEIKLKVDFLSSKIKHDHDFVYTIDRKALGQWQLRQLQGCKNIEIMTRSGVCQVTPEYVVVNGEKIGYRILVGADGSNSKVRRYLGLKTQKRLCAFQYIIPTDVLSPDKFKQFEIYFQPQKFYAWYVWVFPHRNYVCIGTGCDARVFSVARIQKNFHGWLLRHDVDLSCAKYQAFPINADYQGYKFDNVYLVGDAAGLASIFTGEGIYQALVSGREVGRHIIDPGHTPDFKQILKYHHYHERLYALAKKWGFLKVLLYYAGQALLRFSKKGRKKFIEIMG